MNGPSKPLEKASEKKGPLDAIFEAGESATTFSQNIQGNNPKSEFSLKFDFASVLKDAENQAAPNLVGPISALVNVLDEVAKVHAFVALAVIPFKAIINLELTRRQNDRKIAVLINRMGDMMSTLTPLLGTKSDENTELKNTQSLETLLDDITKDMSDCGNTIDVYYKQRTILKVVKSFQWQEKFESFAEKFLEHKQNITATLTVIIHVTSFEANETVKTMDVKLDRVIMLINQFSDNETEALRFMAQNNGIRGCLRDERLFEQLVCKAEGIAKCSPGKDEGDYGGDPYRYRPSGHSRQPRRSYGTPLHSRQYGYASREAYYDTQKISPTSGVILNRDGTMDPADLDRCRMEVKMTLKTELHVILRDNMALWTVKFEHQTETLSRVVETNTMKILDEIRAGPYEKLVDEHMKQIWKANKWTGSVTGSVFLQAVQDYFVELFLGSPNDSAVQKEKWALNFMGTPYRSAMLEVIDVDQSGFISIQEATRFVAAKPEGWSVPIWFAYTAVRWSNDAVYYRDAIASIFDQMNTVAQSLHHLHPNTTEVSTYLQRYSQWIADQLLANLRVPARRYIEACKFEHLSVLLASQMEKQEQIYAEKLKKTRWEIDGPATLAAIGGDGPIEQYILPLLYVLLRHHLRIITECKTFALDSRELEKAWDNIMHVLGSVNSRVVYLGDCFTQQPQRLTPLFDFACGLFASWDTTIMEDGEESQSIGVKPKSADLLEDDTIGPDNTDVLRFGTSPLILRDDVGEARRSGRGHARSRSRSRSRSPRVVRYPKSEYRENSDSEASEVENFHDEERRREYERRSHRSRRSPRRQSRERVYPPPHIPAGPMPFGTPDGEDYLQPQMYPPGWDPLHPTQHWANPGGINQSSMPYGSSPFGSRPTTYATPFEMGRNTQYGGYPQIPYSPYPYRARSYSHMHPDMSRDRPATVPFTPVNIPREYEHDEPARSQMENRFVGRSRKKARRSLWQWLKGSK